MSQMPFVSQPISQFYVHCGPWFYPVIISNEEMVDSEGAPAWAYYDAERFAIVISSALPRHMRVAKIEHELAHIHERVCGKPRNEEERARRKEMVGEQMRRDLRLQGGEAAVWALEVE